MIYRKKKLRKGEYFFMKLKDYLVENGIVHSYFAKKVPTSPQKLSAWIGGHSKPRLESIIKIEELTKGKVAARDWITEKNTTMKQ
jgi:predicted transcriptional regulator